jgi:hypothetical protein
VYFTNLVIETNNEIKLLDAKVYNTYYISANKKLRQILNSNNSYNISHKRQLCITKQLKQKLVTKNAVLVPADNGKTTVNTDTVTYIEKVQSFLAVNVFPILPKDPTENRQKLIHKTLQQCSTFTDKHKIKHLTQKKPSPPILKAQLKLHKSNIPVCPIINNTNKVPTYSFLLPLQWIQQVPACCDTYLQNYMASHLSSLQF